MSVTSSEEEDGESERDELDALENSPKPKPKPAKGSKKERRRDTVAVYPEDTRRGRGPSKNKRVWVDKTETPAVDYPEMLRSLANFGVFGTLVRPITCSVQLTDLSIGQKRLLKLR